MRSAKIIMTGIVALSFVAGCKEKIQLPEQDETQYNQLYMPLAVNNPVVQKLAVSETNPTLVYGVNYGGFGYPAASIGVSFLVNPAHVVDFNAANNTDYELLPETMYSLGASEATIPSGGLATNPLTLSFKTSGEESMDMFKTYLLPLSIESTFKINEDLRTTYYLVTAEPNIADYPDYNRSDWQIIDFSTQEANGEGANNGRALFVLDGNNQTFWHTQWQGANPSPPHHLTIDMGKVQTLHGINTVARQVSGSGGKPEQVRIDVSMDNQVWTAAAHFTLSPSNSQQKTWLTAFADARYFRFVVLSAHGSTHAHLAELGAY